MNNTNFVVRNSYLLAIFFPGIVLRILYIFNHDLWFDEAFSFFVAKQPIFSIIKAIASDNTPPFYYIMLHYWMNIFGYSEVALRSLSLVFGILSIPLIYLFTSSFFNKKLAFITTTLFSFSPLMIYFSAETRMYSMFTFLSLSTISLYLRTIEKPNFKLMISFFLTFVLLLYTHYYAFLLFLPFILILIKKPYRKPILITLVCTLLTTIPWFLTVQAFKHPLAFFQSSFIALPATFISFIISGTGIVSLRTFFDQKIPILAQIIFLITVILFLVLFVVGSIRAIETKHGRIILILLFTPLIFLTIVNLLVPIFSIRSTVFLAPYFFIIVSLGMSKIKYYKYVTSIMCFLFISILILFFTLELLSGPKIKNAIGFTEKLPIVHTSVLTYYSFTYYQPNRVNILIGSNPLNNNTIDIIGGKTQSISLLPSYFYLVEIKNGLDKTEEKSLKKELNRSFVFKDNFQLGDIKLNLLRRHILF